MRARPKRKQKTQQSKSKKQSKARKDDDALLDAAVAEANEERQRLLAEARKVMAVHSRACSKVEKVGHCMIGEPCLVTFDCDQCGDRLDQAPCYVMQAVSNMANEKWCIDCVKTDIEVALRSQRRPREGKEKQDAAEKAAQERQRECG